MGARIFFLALFVLLSSVAVRAQYMPEGGSRYPPPEKCRVVVEDMGNVGFRIADAQAFAERTVRGLRKRLRENGSVIYEGLLKHAKDMKRRLGSSESSLQEDQIAYYKAASKAARWRIQVKFGKKNGKHWVRATCWRAAAGQRKGKPVDTMTWRDKRLDKLKTTYAEKVLTFCLELDPPAPKAPKGKRESTIAPRKKKWALPPMRR